MKVTEIERRISEHFYANGYQIYTVGGCVRDRIIGKTPKDIDMATNALPDESARLLDWFGSIYTVGQKFGTNGITTPDGLTIDVTTYRGEVYPTDERNPNVKFGALLIEDLARRDFTINSIALNPLTGEVYDPFDGEKDIENKIIRCVGSDERLNEDPLRMLRAIRFACQMDFAVSMHIDKPERLQIISVERIRDEFSKILMTDDPIRGIRLMCDLRLMPYVIPGFTDLIGLEQNRYHNLDAFEHTLAVLKNVMGTQSDCLMLRLAALLHDSGKPSTKTVSAGDVHFYGHEDIGTEITTKVLKNLSFDSATVERVSNLVNRHMQPLMLTMGNELNRRGVYRLIRRVSADNYNDINMLMDLVASDLAASANPRADVIENLRKMVNDVQLAVSTKIEYPLGGTEIMEMLDIKASPLIGMIKEYALELVATGAVAPGDKESLRKLARKYYEDDLGEKLQK